VGGKDSQTSQGQARDKPETRRQRQDGIEETSEQQNTSTPGGSVAPSPSSISDRSTKLLPGADSSTKSSIAVKLEAVGVYVQVQV
jgi:hypothetical protein